MNGFLTAGMGKIQMVVYLVRIAAIFIAIPAHEMAHAWVSSKLGDDTAKRYGRLTMNPMAHFDLMGALCMLLAGIGWAKPVPTNVRNFKNPKAGMAITAAAGPVMNLLLAYVGMILYKLVYYKSNGMAVEMVLVALSVFISINISLTVFNLLPIPHFDGSRLATVFLPTRTYFKIMEYEKYIMVGILLVVWLGLLDLPLSILNSWVWHFLDWGTGYLDPILMGSFAYI